MFSVYKQSFEKAGLFVDGDNIVTAKGDVVASIDPYDQVSTKDNTVLQILAQPTTAPKSKAKKKASEEE